MSSDTEREAFEADAKPYGFSLDRANNLTGEPWSDYLDDNTGHRWGGWLAARDAIAVQPPAAIQPKEEADVPFYADVYEQCCAAIRPLVNAGWLPGSVVESMQLLCEAFAAMPPAASQPAPGTASDAVLEAMREIIPYDAWIAMDYKHLRALYAATQSPAASQPSDEPFPGMSEAFEVQSDGWFLPRAKLNAPMLETLEKLIAHAKRARWTNATVRKDSVETVYEADWIKWLTPIAAAQVAPSQPSDAVDAARYRLLEGEAYECVVPHGNKVEGVRTAWITKLHAGSTFSDAIDRALAAVQGKK